VGTKSEVSASEIPDKNLRKEVQYFSINHEIDQSGQEKVD